MTAGTNTAGEAILTSSSAGDTRGIRITQSQTVSSAIIYYGESLVDTLSKYINSISSSTGVLTKSQLNAGNLLSEYNIDLISIDEKVETLTERYKAQFGAMESAVTSLKSTGEYLTNMMDSWNKEN
jgi:flagellar hook-associated protein 2